MAMITAAELAKHRSRMQSLAKLSHSADALQMGRMQALTE